MLGSLGPLTVTRTNTDPSPNASRIPGYTPVGRLILLAGTVAITRS